MPQVRPCSICHGPGEGQFFGVFACRCCAAFFRRSTRESKQYICRAEGNCPINQEGMRNSCRACRLKTCLRAGMKLESNRRNEKNPRAGRPRRFNNEADEGHSNPQTTASTALVAYSSPQIHSQNSLQQQQHLIGSSSFPSTSSYPSAFMPFSHHHQMPSPNLFTSLNIGTSVPASLNLAKAIGTFKERLRACCAQQFDDLNIALDNGHSRHITINEMITIDRISAPLYMELMISQFPEFASFERNQKVQMLHDLMINFGFFLVHKITMQAFPDFNEKTKQVIVLPGCVMDTESDVIFETTTGIGLEEHKRLFRELIKRHVNFILQRYKPLAISELEFAAMAGILLWNGVIKSCGDNFMAPRNALLEELHVLATDHCRQSGSGTSGAIRFGQLMLLLWDGAERIVKPFNEVVTFSNIFLDKSSNLDYETIFDHVI